MHWTRYLEDPALNDFVGLEIGRTRILVRRGFEGCIGSLGLEGEAVEADEWVGGGRRPHPLLELAGGERVLVRRYLRGGAVRHLNRERYFLGHRAFDELKATERARAGGARVPDTVAAAQRALPFGYAAFLATRWIPHSSDLHGWLLSADSAGKEAVLHEAGRQIGLLHEAGVAHPDLNLRNLLVGNGGGDDGEGVQLFVLDFDRARLYDGPVPAGRRARDLRRLARSARKLGSSVSSTGWEALRRGYAGGWPLDSPLT